MGMGIDAHSLRTDESQCPVKRRNTEPTARVDVRKTTRPATGRRRRAEPAVHAPGQCPGWVAALA